MTSVPPTILLRVRPQEQEERGQQGEVDELGKKVKCLYLRYDDKAHRVAKSSGWLPQQEYDSVS